MVGKILTFNSNNNKLEGVLYEPKGDKKVISIVLHPHPEFGGSMHNNVVNGVCEVMQEFGGAFKFNCSGVGGSTGRFEGFSKAYEDVKNAVLFLREELNYINIGFIGYSWGSYAGLKALIEDNSMKFLCGISPVISMWNYNFLTKNTSKQPKCFVIGENDTFCNNNKFIKIYEKIPIENKAYKILSTNHFYAGYEKLAANFILKFIQNQI